MASYISAIFEKTRLEASAQIRVITRNRDDGGVPPQPGPSHFPTVPDDLQGFIVGQYINSTLGESYERIATIDDITNIALLELDYFQDTGATFITSGLIVGDLVSITIPDAAEWLSAEYVSGNPFVFQVSEVISETALKFTRPLPAFQATLPWTVARVSASGTGGVTRRNGLPAPGSLFRDTRFHRLFSSTVAAENAVIAMKADIRTLLNANEGAQLITETVTVSPTI